MNEVGSGESDASSACKDFDNETSSDGRGNGVELGSDVDDDVASSAAENECCSSTSTSTTSELGSEARSEMDDAFCGDVSLSAEEDEEDDSTDVDV